MIGGILRGGVWTWSKAHLVEVLRHFGLGPIMCAGPGPPNVAQSALECRCSGPGPGVVFGPRPKVYDTSSKRCLVEVCGGVGPVQRHGGGGTESLNLAPESTESISTDSLLNPNLPKTLNRIYVKMNMAGVFAFLFYLGDGG